MNDTRREERIKRDAEKFRANLQIGRPGFGESVESNTIERVASVSAGDDRIELSGILWLDPQKLKENPYNEYVSLSDEELAELARDIAQKGVLVPLIIRLSEDVLICGHNRRKASIDAKEPQVPVQRVLRLLSEPEEREIMKSENDRRRGGNWSKEQKVEFIREHFGDVIHNVSHGGDRKSKKRNQSSVNLENQIGNEAGSTDQSSMNLEIVGEESGKKFSELLQAGNQNYTEVLKKGEANTDQSSVNLDAGSGSLAKEIEEKSRGNITEGTAKRLISDMRKEKKRTEKSPAVREKEKSSLSAKERKRAEKLAVQIATVRQLRDGLEQKLKNAKEEEKRLLKELRAIGQPELFGVD